MPALRSLRTRLRSHLYHSIQGKSSSSKLDSFGRGSDGSKEKPHLLTLGSNVNDGKFMRTQQKEWPLVGTGSDEDVERM